MAQQSTVGQGQGGQGVGYQATPPQEATGWASPWNRPKGTTAIQPFDPDIEAQTGRKVTRFAHFGLGPKNRFQFDFADGEYHRVLSSGTAEHGALIDPRSRRERVAMQLNGRVNRKRARRMNWVAFFKGLPMAALITFIYWYVWRSQGEPLPGADFVRHWLGVGKGLALYATSGPVLRGVWQWLTDAQGPIAVAHWVEAFVMVGFVLLILRVGWQILTAPLRPAVALVNIVLPEFVYQLGWQWSFIDGPKVFDPAPSFGARETPAPVVAPMGNGNAAAHAGRAAGGSEHPI